MTRVILNNKIVLNSRVYHGNKEIIFWLCDVAYLCGWLRGFLSGCFFFNFFESLSEHLESRDAVGEDTITTVRRSEEREGGGGEGREEEAEEGG